jgi:SAM-dependent methyltransferase
MTSTAKYQELVSHYESCLRTHGDNHRGVDWPNAVDARTRYQIMLDVIRTPARSPVRLLDLGCGASHLYEFLRETRRTEIEYTGLDLSPEFIRLSRKKFPDVPFYCLDVLDPAVEVATFDYVVMNGVFTERRSLSFDEMWIFVQAMVTRAFELATVGVAFNVMSKHVDWEREDLFHLPLDVLAQFLTGKLGRHFVIRSDYGLYEYTTFVYHDRA